MQLIIRRGKKRPLSFFPMSYSSKEALMSVISDRIETIKKHKKLITKNRTLITKLNRNIDISPLQRQQYSVTYNNEIYDYYDVLAEAIYINSDISDEFGFELNINAVNYYAMVPAVYTVDEWFDEYKTLENPAR